jgi:hypothetical protein
MAWHLPRYFDSVLSPNIDIIIPQITNFHLYQNQINYEYTAQKL